MTPAERIAAAEAWLSKLPDAEHIHITRHPDGTLSADPMERAEIDDPGQCPYYQRNYCGDLTISREDAVCDRGCTDEPECMTCCPENGWPSAVGAWVDCPTGGDIEEPA